MTLLAVPYVAFTGREAFDEAKNAKILDGAAGLPNLFPLRTTPEERRHIVASYLVDPCNVIWEVWQTGAPLPKATLVGIFMISRVVRGLDALAHLAFFDRQLLGKRAVILQTMRRAFRELDLQRLSLEIPAHLDPLIRFARTKLGFRYEGEPAAGMHAVAGRLGPLGVNNAGKWLAHFGSRREHAHFDGTQWQDVVCLRLLREEFEQLT